MVLELGWAYGPGGTRLSGKYVFNVITTGGPQEAYTHEGRHRFTLNELLAPFNQTANLCQMKYLPPFSIQGTHRLTDSEVEHHACRYGQMLRKTVAGEFMI